MCRASAVASDWIVKGCHIHVEGIELAVRPDGRGGIIFCEVFSSAAMAPRFANAVRVAKEVCLADAEVRRRWITQIEGAMLNLFAETGRLRRLARGRLAELHFFARSTEEVQIDVRDSGALSQDRAIRAA